MRLKISHTTHYRFANPVTYGLQQVRKTPKSSHNQSIIHWSTRVEGGRKELTFDDHHNNVVELLSFERDTEELLVHSVGEVDVAQTHGVVGKHIGPSPLWLYKSSTERTKVGQASRALLRGVDGGTELEKMHALVEVIQAAVRYEVGSSNPDWTAEDALAAGAGVCQDHTHIFLACARELDIPARYVSGYLMLNDVIEQDAMHAWAEAHIDGLGWVGFDVSNGISPDTRYVRVATGLDYSEAAPVIGSRLGGAGEALSVQIEVAQQ